MGTLTTAERAELLVSDGENQLPILPNSIVVTGDDPTCIGWSPLYGNGQIDVTGEHAGSALITVTLGQSVGSLEVTVTEGEAGELVVTLGPVRPK
jgi:hypothetical protein